jgi:hypothetical protein
VVAREQAAEVALHHRRHPTGWAPPAAERGALAHEPVVDVVSTHAAIDSLARPIPLFAEYVISIDSDA